MNTFRHTCFPPITGAETTFLDSAVRAGEVSRDYDDLMGAFHNAFFAKDTVTMDYIEQVRYLIFSTLTDNAAVSAGSTFA